MKKVLFIISLIFMSKTQIFAGCCCYPVISCAAVEVSTEIARTQNLNDINTEDINIGNSWIQKVEQELKELNELKEIGLKHQKNTSDLEYANLIESYNEELAYLNILEYKKVDFDERVVNNKLNLLESSITIQLNQIENQTKEKDLNIK